MTLARVAFKWVILGGHSRPPQKLKILVNTFAHVVRAIKIRDNCHTVRPLIDYRRRSFNRYSADRYNRLCNRALHLA